MQHWDIHEAVDHTFRDICNCTDKPFGGLSIVFGGDFQQILPVIPKGSRGQMHAFRSQFYGAVCSFFI
jgi:hypothetical protein